MKPGLDFVHEFVSGSSKRTLLLLHGTGGNERDLIPLGREIDPTAAILSPRGKVLENGMPRFFRRLAEGIFDRSLLSAIPTARTSQQACCYFGRKHFAPLFYFGQWCPLCLKNCRIFHLRTCGSARETKTRLFRHPRLSALSNSFATRERTSQFDFSPPATT